MRVIECKGTPYEIGRQIGEGCKDILQHSVETTLGILARGYQSNVEEVVQTAGKFIDPVRKYDPDFIAQLRGQAEGSGIPFEKLFALRCLFEMSYYYKQIQGLCTSFAVTGAATKDGKTILGQNIDWLGIYEPYVLHIEHENGLKQLAISLAGMVEYTLNSNGFGNCANSLFTKTDTYQFSLPLGCYLPKVMRQSSMEEAVQILVEVARGVGYFHLADKAGNMVGIESTFLEVEQIKPKNDVLFHANCYCTERFQKEDMASYILPDAFHRHQRIQDLIAASYGKITPEIMMKTLTNHTILLIAFVAIQLQKKMQLGK